MKFFFTRCSFVWFFCCSGENANPIEDARSMLMMFFLWLTSKKSENQHTEGEKKWILNLTENFCGDLRKFLIKNFREKVFFFSTLRCRPNQAWTRGKFREENRITNTTEPSSSTSNIVSISRGSGEQFRTRKKRRHDTTTQFA